MGYDYYFDDLRDIQEVSDLIEFLKSQETIKAIYLRESRQEYVLEDFWRRLLTNILAETDGIKVNRTTFDKWFDTFVKELCSDTSVWRAVDVIDGLILEGKELRLDEYTSLISIPPHDPWYWLERLVPKHDRHFEASEFLRHQWDGAFPTEQVTLVVTTMRIPKREVWPWKHPENKINQIGRALAAISAIRLMRPGAPRLVHRAVFHLSCFPLADPFGYSPRDGSRRMYEKEATISKGDYRKIKSLWQELFRTKHQMPIDRHSKVSPMDIAEARFFKSYEPDGWFENILDLTIALEALFSPPDSQELSHRIALRCAWLLGAYPARSHDHNRVYESVRDMYALRSAIVHGDTPEEKRIQKWIGTLAGTAYDRSKDWVLREQALESARDIVRRSLAACARLSKLSHEGPHWPLPREFDQCMVQPLQRRLWQKAAGIGLFAP